jgi:hypothetical protein
VEVIKSRARLASVTLRVLGVLGLVLMAAWVLLTCLTATPRSPATVPPRRPTWPAAWWTCWWPEVAVIGKGSIGEPLIFCFVLIILLFPDGRLTRRWTWVLRIYLILTVGVTVGSVASEAGTVAGQHIQVDLNGTYTGPGSPAGVLGMLAAASAGILLVPLFWPTFAARQVVSWRRSAGERLQQLKWLMGGAVLALTGFALIVLGPPNDQLSGRVVRDLAFVALAALPVSIGVGILKYHLYDIDRLISRTLSYTLVTGLLVGVYAGLVLLATEVFRSPTPVAVAASTLAVATLFNPLRRRVQRAVDRRFQPGQVRRGENGRR